MPEQGLFGEMDESADKPGGGKKRAKRKAGDAPANPDIKACIDFFHDEHKRAWGIPPLIVGARHGQQFRALLAQVPAEEVRALIRLYFRIRDPRITRTDYSLSSFFVHADYLRICRARGSGRSEDPRTQRNLDAADRATRMGGK